MPALTKAQIEQTINGALPYTKPNRPHVETVLIRAAGVLTESIQTDANRFFSDYAYCLHDVWLILNAVYQHNVSQNPAQLRPSILDVFTPPLNLAHQKLLRHLLAQYKSELSGESLPKQQRELLQLLYKLNPAQFITSFGELKTILAQTSSQNALTRYTQTLQRRLEELCMQMIREQCDALYAAALSQLPKEQVAALLTIAAQDAQKYYQQIIANGDLDAPVNYLLQDRSPVHQSINHAITQFKAGQYIEDTLSAARRHEKALLLRNFGARTVEYYAAMIKKLLQPRSSSDANLNARWGLVFTLMFIGTAVFSAALGDGMFSLMMGTVGTVTNIAIPAIGLAASAPPALAFGDISAWRSKRLQEFNALKGTVTPEDLAYLLEQDQKWDNFFTDELITHDLLSDTKIAAEQAISATTTRAANAAANLLEQNIGNSNTMSAAGWAAIKTLISLIVTGGGSILLGMWAAGYTGSMLFFAMAPAWSLGIIGALTVFVAKMTFKDPQTPAGWLTNAAVDIIHAPIAAITYLARALPRPLYAVQQAYEEGKLMKLAIYATAALAGGIAFAAPILVLSAYLPGLTILAGITGAIGAYVGTALSYTGEIFASSLQETFAAIQRKITLNNLFSTIQEKNDTFIAKLRAKDPNVAEVAALIAEKTQQIQTQIDALPYFSNSTAQVDAINALCLDLQAFATTFGKLAKQYRHHEASELSVAKQECITYLREQYLRDSKTFVDMAKQNYAQNKQHASSALEAPKCSTDRSKLEQLDKIKTSIDRLSFN